MPLNQAALHASNADELPDDLFHRQRELFDQPVSWYTPTQRTIHLIAGPTT